MQPSERLTQRSNSISHVMGSHVAGYRNSPIPEGEKEMNDDLLEKLGIYFVYHDIYNRLGITFETFVKRYMQGAW